MTVSTNARLTSNTLTRILALLEGIKNSDTGAILYQYIEKSLHELEADQQQSEQQYQQLLNKLLNNLSLQLPDNSAQQVQLYILKTSIVPSISKTDLEECCNQLEGIFQSIKQQDSTVEPHGIQLSLNTLVDGIGLQNNAAQSASPPPQSQPPAEASNQENLLSQPTVEVTNQEDLPSATSNNHSVPQEDSEELPLETSSSFTDLARNNIENIHNGLAEQISNARSLNDELARLLSRSFSIISQVDKHADLKVAKQTFLRRYTKLIKIHQDLTSKFDKADDNLRNIESNSENFNAELNRVHQLGYTDALTTLPNRRAFLEKLDDEIARSRRHHLPLTLALLDLDHFKSINDKFGHTTGDNILQLAAQHMKTVFRYHDIAARYGGEEFAVLFPNTDIEGASLALNKLQEQLGNDLYISDNNEEVPIPSFSAGVTLFDGEESPETFIQRADTALYKAKDAGRCRIEVHGAETTPNDAVLSAKELNNLNLT